MCRTLEEGVEKPICPRWAASFFENYGSPSLDELGDVFHGPLLDRKYGLRKDDLVEMLLDKEDAAR